MKEIRKYDFVKLEETSNYYFVYDIQNDVATIVGMKLTESGDSIMFYSRFINTDKLKFVNECFINMNGSLAILRDNIKNGIDNYYIEGIIA